MQMPQLHALETQVLWAMFAVAFSFGALAQRTNFCTMGAISDVYNMGNWVRMRMWGLAVGVATVSFYLMVWLGWIDASKSIYGGARLPWLSALLGGAMFGFGMVLASGCGSKTLVRIGAGSLKSLVVFIVMGLAAFATMRGMTGLLRSKTIDAVAIEIAPGTTLPAWLSVVMGADAATTGLVLALLVGAGLIGWALWSAAFRSTPNNWLAGLGIGALVAAAWWVSGDLGFVAEHPETMEPVYLGAAGGRMQALSFTSPMARTLDWVINYDPDKALTFGVVLVVGVVLGALAYALYARSFQWEGFSSTQDTALHIVGGALMGVGGVTAGGCTVGQGLSGMSTLSLTSLIAVTGIMLGAVGALRLQMWLLMREMAAEAQPA